MNGKQYVNAVAKKIKCGGKRKKEIKKQLLTDIEARVNQGEDLKEIIAQMGAVKEIADGFNENITAEEKKQYIRNRVLRVILFIIAVLIFLGLLVYWLTPKITDIEQSAHFGREQVEAAMKETVELFDAGDYTALQEKSLSKIRPYLNAESMGKAKAALLADWGERKSFGQTGIVDMKQGNRHFAIGEIEVVYENIRVIYRLTYTEDMRLAGIYFRGQ